MIQEVLRMERVTYIERENRKLEDFNLQICRGEIMGLLPLNGHGLQAFLSLLQQNLPLYDGYIYYNDELINSWRDSKRDYNRITIVRNKSSLVEGMTVSDNIFVIRKGFRQVIVRPKILASQLMPYLKKVGVDISPDSYVERLSTFERVVVEMLRAVVMGHHLIVLDEIGALINEKELKKLQDIMRLFAKEGFSFLYISLYYEEILDACDRCVILSDGRIPKIIQKEELASNAFWELCKGLTTFVSVWDRHKGLNSISAITDEPVVEEDIDRDIVFSMKNISYHTLEHMNLQVHKGECITLQCMDNAVFDDLTTLLSGEHIPEGGVFALQQEGVVLAKNPEISMIPEEPTNVMLFYEMSYRDNLCLGLYERLGKELDSEKIWKSVQSEYSEFLGRDTFGRPISDLSEREKYSLIYARILLQKPKVVFCVKPFKGADLSHRIHIWKLIEKLLAEKIAVVMLTINLADCMSLASRLLRVDKKGFIMELSKEEYEAAIRK